MDLEDVSEEIRAALGGITGLRRPPWGVEKATPPAALVAMPDRISFDETYGRGKDAYKDVAVIILVGNPTLPGSRKLAAAYADGSGAKSVKATLEGYAWTTCESLHVAWAEFDVPKFGGTDYLAVIFHLDIVGKGV